MKQKLTDHYVDEVSFHEVSKIETTVILQRKEKIIDNFYKIKIWEANQLKKEIYGLFKRLQS